MSIADTLVGFEQIFLLKTNVSFSYIELMHGAGFCWPMYMLKPKLINLILFVVEVISDCEV